MISLERKIFQAIEKRYQEKKKEQSLTFTLRNTSNPK